MGDGAQVFHQFLARHADAEVLDGDGAGRVVGGEVDFERQVVVKGFLAGELQVAEFLEGVGGVGHQFAQEDFAIGVQGVDNEVEELADFGLEGVPFRLAHGCVEK